MKVKICGITHIDDALLACDAGADAIGFVFYDQSPRYITPSNAKAIVDALPPFVQKVGLFVNQDATTINAIVKEAHLGLVQLYDSKVSADLDCPFVLVNRIASAVDIPKHLNRHAFVDAFVEGFGGQGKRIDLNWFDGIDCSKMILAGGLQAKDLELIKPYGFYGVDVSSGVESSRGIKCHQKIKNFIRNAKSHSCTA